MTHITQITLKESRFGSRILVMALVVSGILAMQSVTVQAQWTSPDANGTIHVTATSNVGIGTTSPAGKLDVQRADGSDLLVRAWNSATSSGAAIFRAAASSNGNEASRIEFTNSVGWTGGMSGDNTNGLIFRTGNQTASYSAMGARMAISTAGNVGIGTTSPARKLHVFGSNSQVFVDRTANTAGNYALLNFATNGVQKFFLGMNADSDPNVDKLSLFDSAASATIPVMTFTGGKVGIGTTGPNFKLDVQGGQVNGALGLCMAGVCKSTWSETSQWTPAGSNIHYSTGTVGVGAASPGSPLFVAGNEPSTDYATLRVKPTLTHGGIVIDSASNATQAHLRFFKSGVPKWQFRVPFQDGVEDFRLFSWATGSDVLNVTPAGNVGIGTGATAPSTKLHVAGDLTVSGTGNINASGTITGGTINAKYQDVAEWVESSQTLAAGTVVVLDHTRSNQVIASSQAYDTRVAGVISLQPGLTLGESGAGKVLVATTGRVKIKVDATAGPIQIGDLLVTSDKEGLAKKSDPLSLGSVQIHRPGTLIGKALEPLAKGTGEILVLLSLQ